MESRMELNGTLMKISNKRTFTILSYLTLKQTILTNILLENQQEHPLIMEKLLQNIKAEDSAVPWLMGSTVYLHLITNDISKNIYP